MNKVARLIILGSSAGIPQSERGLSAIALEIIKKFVVLMDAGEGTQLMFSKAGLSLSKLKYILITHMHGDHIFGLPGIIQTRSMMGIQDKLIIIGPRGIKEFVESVNKITMFEPLYNVEVLEDCSQIDLGFLKIEKFITKHVVPSFGYKLELDLGKRNIKIVYTGDTAPLYNLNEFIYDIDILIHDSTFHSSLKEEAHKFGHSTSYDAGFIAEVTRSKVLILHHISNRYRGKEHILLSEAKKFVKRVYIGKPLLTFFL